ncbi:tetratricopeptide repeat protein [Occallatibacter riparius]|uniref:Tetratricopeptide repeat protein n=1 Tax=Occallatibacter riparius TaxID=1002689 RepID=A0A9J7BKQ3_9BACT|nr:tetratricopeptide repeat protein [Occallatibacter riparius]UWZ83408.1 tetratricopeptide repeat protein [Occallatibacter riparius]
MSRTVLRRAILTVIVVAFSLTVTYAVLAASGPGDNTSAAAPAGDAPSTAGAAYTANIKITGPTTQFHNTVAAKYNYAFGKESPFLPSNAMSANGQFISPKSFPTAEYCGHCHKAAYHQWRESVHSNSFRAPWYLKNVNMLIDEKGVQFSRHCEGCHNPVALLSGDLTQGMPKKRPFEDEGITCSTCHSIQSTDATGTGSYVMGIPAVLVDEKGEPVTRQVSDAEILAHLDRHSKAVMRPLYKTAEFCAACHKAAIPTALDDYKFLRAFSVYDEWQGASFTKQSPLPFYRKDSVSQCQTCHMPKNDEAAEDPGAKDGRFASHRWLGGNSLMPAYYHYDEQAKKLADFLRNGPDGKGVLNVDIFGLEKENAAATSTDNVEIAPLGLTHFAIAPGETLTADVVIQNKGIAHSLVPEQRDFYESWVDFVVKDEAGKVLAESGFIKPDGELDPSAHSFTNRLINTKGELNDIHQIWHNRVLAYNNSIQSGRSQLARYRFRLPKNAKGKYTITATVKYRRFNQHFVDYAMADDPTMPGSKKYPMPVMEIATETRTLYVGDNPPVQPGPDENKEWMRWNNYGIALLDAQQYAASVHAFERVAALRPDYADAFTNMAVVEISWERYDDAKANLAKALTLLPNDPRALYYRALVERNAGQVDEAIADLEAVVAAYPRSKDGWRELGFSRYQKHDYPGARDAYEKLQSIDPDDLAAHYQLAILYRRTGDKARAAIENAKFTDQKDDPTASEYALQFLGKHPEVAAESVVWHTHDLTGDKKAPQKIHYTYIPGAGF